MNSRQTIQSAMDLSIRVLNSYISDLSDADLLRRPATGCNHLAWQLGHLIASEVSLLNMVSSGKGADLPPGFAEQHSKQTIAVDDAAKFCTKQQYQELFQKVRQATSAALANLTDADLDRPSPERMRDHFPTVGHMLLLIASHPMMHAGQFVVVRRQLGKPVLI